MCDDTKQANKNKALDSFFRFIDSWNVNENENKTTDKAIVNHSLTLLLIFFFNFQSLFRVA